MEFYYWSILSLVPLGIAYVFVVVFFSIVVAASKSLKRGRAAFLVVVGAIFLVLPISEELWIAWNFGQACKSAGTFITKTVQVDGFYDDRMHSAYELTRSGIYKFVEQKAEDGKGYERVEKADDKLRFEALDWYVKNNQKLLPKDQSISYPVSNNEKIVVFPSGVEAWRVTRLGRPAARYWFQESEGEKITHKVGLQQSTVTDTVSGEVIARYVRYHRQAPWFFISVAAPAIACDKPGTRLATGTFLIYEQVLRSNKY